MTPDPLWLRVVRDVVIGVSIAGALGWVASLRGNVEQANSSAVLRHSVGFLIIGAVCGVFFGGCTILSALQAPAKDRWVVPFFFAMFAMSGALVVESIRARHYLSEHGIAYRGLFASHGVPWKDVARAQWSESGKWLVVTTHRGVKLRFPAALIGFDILAVMLHKYCPDMASDEQTRALLERARSGELPPLQ